MANLTELETIDGDNPFILHPGEFVLAVTKERVEIPSDLVGRLDGKSSLGRLGLIVHSTAGFVDPGFSGRLTLELTNIANLPIMLYNDMPISQISFVRLTTPADAPYGTGAGNKYQGQNGPEPSRYFLNYGAKPADTSPTRPHRRRR
jgi:dCTP deaminase